MRIFATRTLFAWNWLEDSPSLKTLQDLLALLPDGELLEGMGGVACDIPATRAGDGETLPTILARSDDLRPPRDLPP